MFKLGHYFSDEFESELNFEKIIEKKNTNLFFDLNRLTLGPIHTISFADSHNFARHLGNF